jgi:hypothetical protein
MFCFPAGSPHQMFATWSDIQFTLDTVAVTHGSWGQVKGLYR